MNIQGVEVLSYEPIKDFNMHYVIPCCVIALIIFAFLIFMLLASDCPEEIFPFLVLIVSLSIIFLINKYGMQETGRYRYEVTINDDVSFKDIYENYEIVDQKGKVYTLIDKED